MRLRSTLSPWVPGLVLLLQPVVTPAQVPGPRQTNHNCTIKTPRHRLNARRAEVQKWIFSGRCEHAATRELMEIGNIESVPALLRVLENHPPVARPNGRTAVSMTAALAVATLQRITGLSMGMSYSEWHDWWQTYGQH